MQMRTVVAFIIAMTTIVTLSAAAKGLSEQHGNFVRIIFSSQQQQARKPPVVVQQQPQQVPVVTVATSKLHRPAKLQPQQQQQQQQQQETVVRPPTTTSAAPPPPQVPSQTDRQDDDAHVPPYYQSLATGQVQQPQFPIASSGSVVVDEPQKTFSQLKVPASSTYQTQLAQPDTVEFQIVQQPQRPVVWPAASRLEQIPGPIPPPPVELQPETVTVQPAKKVSAFEVNFCNRDEFSDEELARFSLERVEYFVGNFSCSPIFFQCSIGQTFMLRCPSDGEAWDRETVNCNFRNSVKVCPEYDHVMHCTVRETCSSDEFACCAQPQQCLPMSRRCDGRPDCADGEDENNCPSCARDQFACVKSGRCIPSAARCDGILDDCGDGSNLDELGCSRNSTCVGKFMCHSSAALGGAPCIDYELHCDGTAHCAAAEDELNCKKDEAKYLLCENQKQSVLKMQWCDGANDCADASDEKYCKR